MKKWISGVIILVVVILLGGWMYIDHANKENIYQTNLKNGNIALQNHDYNQAKKDFQKALDAKPDSKKVNGSVSQVEKYTDGERQLRSNDFVTAKNSFKMAANVENGSKDLANQAQQKIKEVKLITANINQFNKIYKATVQQHNEKNYQLSNDTLNQILDDDTINQSYYADVLAKAKDLKKSNDKSIDAANKAKLNNSNANNGSNNGTNSSNGNSNDLSQFNVYTNPQEYANRFVNSGTSSNTSTVDNTNIANGPVSVTNDPYDVYTKPNEYSNRFN